MLISRGPLVVSMLIATVCGAPSAAVPKASPERVPAAPSPSASTQLAASAPAGVILETTRAADDISLTVSSPVRRGRIATASATTAPNAMCTIVATYPSAPVAAGGLEAKGADGSGSVSWSWTIGADAPVGESSVDVSCQLPSGQRTVARQALVIE